MSKRYLSDHVYTDYKAPKRYKAPKQKEQLAISTQHRYEWCNGPTLTVGFSSTKHNSRQNGAIFQLALTADSL